MARTPPAGLCLGPGSTFHALAAAKVGGRVAERLDVGTRCPHRLGCQTLPIYLKLAGGCDPRAAVFLAGDRSDDSSSSAEDPHYA